MMSIAPSTSFGKNNVVIIVFYCVKLCNVVVVVVVVIEKKSMGGEMSFRPLVRPHHSLPFVTIVVCDLSCQKCS